MSSFLRFNVSIILSRSTAQKTGLNWNHPSLWSSGITPITRDQLGMIITLFIVLHSGFWRSHYETLAQMLTYELRLIWLPPNWLCSLLVIFAVTVAEQTTGQVKYLRTTVMFGKKLPADFALRTPQRKLSWECNAILNHDPQWHYQFRYYVP